ncbi:capsular polysaccharide biosynthesis protein [Micromonospora luteifusca]|uniref:Capsular polysaccharide biosynthesis protein n=1 Tax=Micromonospora luteifusca TaxID=709860 RepID=A0ABS2M0B0_9ACTN|nr:lipopolysaccharide biosynthesis protein [Micromonospora luteifusca]MBM7493875.1 capsular polysaccharide biosynthesis protein [Micromonospora luteifusca]
MADAPSGTWSADALGGGGTSVRTVTLTDLLRVPLHRIRLVGAVAAVGLLAVLGYVVLMPSAVTASAVVAVRPVVTDAFTPSGAAADRAVNMNVESGIATGTEVVQRLAAEGGDPREVRDALEVEVPTGGQILRFSYTGRSADEAVRNVNLAAQTYLDVRRTMYEKQRAEMLKRYDESIVEVDKQREILQRRIVSARDGSLDAAIAELGGTNSQLTQLRSARTEIAAVDVNPGWITQSAENVLVSSGRHILLYVLAGLLGGTLLGVVLAFAWESADRRVRSVHDGRDVTGLPLLGTVRGGLTAGGLFGRGLLGGGGLGGGLFGGRRKVMDADIRYVAMAIAERVREPARVALLTTREDPTAITASLAVALAAPGRDVYVADDSGRLERLRTAVLADREHLPAAVNSARPLVPKPRGTDAVSGNGATGQVPTRRPSPYPVGSRPLRDPDATLTLPRTSPDATTSGLGTAGTNAGEVPVGAGGVRFGTWRQRVTTGVVLFNAPPSEADERGVAVARQGAAVVVVEQDRTRHSDLRRLVERLRAAGVTPLGFVLTGRGRG